MVTFKPDPTIFKAGVAFDADTLATRFDEQAYLHAGLNITMIDERYAVASRAAGVEELGSDAGGAEAAAVGLPAPHEAAGLDGQPTGGEGAGGGNGVVDGDGSGVL